jgi:hypothetical protein
MEHIWSVLCEQALQNPQTGAMSHINTLDVLPVNLVNKETGELEIKPFLFATKWKKNTEESFKAYIKIEILSESDEDSDSFGTREIDLPKGTGIVSLNIDVTKMLIKRDSPPNAFKILFKYGKQKKYREAAVLPFTIEKPTEEKKKEEK